jgi:bacterial/archaeal transporter family-2 protein
MTIAAPFIATIAGLLAAGMTASLGALTARHQVLPTLAAFSVASGAVTVALFLADGNGAHALRTAVAAPPWMWLPTVSGPIFAGLASFAVPRIGTAGSVAFLVGGQLSGSLALDYSGFSSHHRPSLLGVLGIAAVFVGAALTTAARPAEPDLHDG